MVVTLKASHIVKPAEVLPEEVMYLSECDQIKPVTHAPTVYFYKLTTEKPLEELVQILKDSLSKALVTFYPLAGRLYWTTGGRVELHCNSAGALLLEAESDLTMDDFGDFAPTPEIRSLIPSVDLSTTPIEEVPVLIAQLTKLRCGGIGFGLGMSHIVIDGLSAIHFVTEWSKIARGEHSDDHPFLDRRVLDQNEDQTSALPDLQYSDFFRLPLILGQSDNQEERKKETRAMMLKLSKEQIETLRYKANLGVFSKEQLEALKKLANNGLHTKEQALKEKAHVDPDGKLQHEALIKSQESDQDKVAAGNPTEQELQSIMSFALKNKLGQYPFSRFEALCAHIWKCASMARGLKPEQETVLFISVDFRNRIKPALPQRYFGNAVMPLPVSTTVDELLSKPLSDTARKIRAAVENVTDEYVRSYLQCIKNIPDISSKRHFHTVGCAKGSFFGNPNLILTSWTGLPLYGTNFGWGDEVFIGPGSLGYDGRAFFIPSKNGDGSFFIPFRFQVEHLDDFQKYFYEEI